MLVGKRGDKIKSSQQEKRKNLESIKATRSQKTRLGQEILRVNITLTGEIPEFYRQLKQRGLVTSTRDFVIQMFQFFQEHLIELDLKKAQLENLQEHSTGEG